MTGKNFYVDQAEFEDLKTTVRALTEVIHTIAERQGWGYRSIPEWVQMFTFSGPDLELAEMLPAVRRTFVILEESRG